MRGQIDEQKLGALIWGKINEIATNWLNLDIPTADCRPENFPSFFVYFYAYYFWSLKNKQKKHAINDFNDLAHTIIAPYCKLFYIENKLALLLRNEIQGRIPPNPYATTKKLFKNGLVEKETYQKARYSEDMRHPVESRLLEKTTIHTYSEMRKEILDE